MDAIKTALEGARGYVSSHPDEASYTDTVARAVADSGLRVQVAGPDGEELTTDFPTSVGGSGSAPSPGWFLRAAEASCVAALVVMRAASVGLTAIRVEVTVDSISDDRGILGLDDAITAGPASTRVAICASGVDPATQRQAGGDLPLGRRPLSRGGRGAARDACHGRDRDRLKRPARMAARYPWQSRTNSGMVRPLWHSSYPKHLWWPGSGARTNSPCPTPRWRQSAQR